MGKESTRFFIGVVKRKKSKVRNITKNFFLSVESTSIFLSSDQNCKKISFYFWSNVNRGNSIIFI